MDMPMVLNSSLAFGGAAIFIACGFAIVSRFRPAKAWIFPAVGSLLFLGFSLFAVFQEGPTGFWPEHTRSFWGNQIWFDLLLSVLVGWTLMVPQAKAQGMRPLLWFALIVATGSVGFLAMLSRLLYLKESR